MRRPFPHAAGHVYGGARGVSEIRNRSGVWQGPFTTQCEAFQKCENSSGVPRVPFTGPAEAFRKARSVRTCGESHSRSSARRFGNARTVRAYRDTLLPSQQRRPGNVRSFGRAARWSAGWQGASPECEQACAAWRRRVGRGGSRAPVSTCDSRTVIRLSSSCNPMLRYMGYRWCRREPEGLYVPDLPLLQQ
jgi:hypothetical protein